MIEKAQTPPRDGSGRPSFFTMRRSLGVALALSLYCGVAASDRCTGIEQTFPRTGSVLCCPKACGVCGGSACSKAPVADALHQCCPGPIKRAGRACGEGDTGPCVVKLPGDPSCSTGVVVDGYCYPAACGKRAGKKPDCVNALADSSSSDVRTPRTSRMPHRQSQECCPPSARKMQDSPRDCKTIDPPCRLGGGK